MRLGRERPRKAAASAGRFMDAPGFNEAGARTPQKECKTPPPPKSQARMCFNEAGARTPQKEGNDPSRSLSCLLLQ